MDVRVREDEMNNRTAAVSIAPCSIVLGQLEEDLFVSSYSRSRDSAALFVASISRGA